MKFLKLILVSHLKTSCHCKLSCFSLNINNAERAYSNFTSFTIYNANAMKYGIVGTG